MRGSSLALIRESKRADLAESVCQFFLKAADSDFPDFGVPAAATLVEIGSEAELLKLEKWLEKNRVAPGTERGIYDDIKDSYDKLALRLKPMK